VRLAHQFAMESDLITADCIEATEFPDAATEYSVYAVPKTIINHQQSIEGSVPEGHFLEAVLGVVNPPEGGQEA
jgi:Thioredoxin domain